MPLPSPASTRTTTPRPPGRWALARWTHGGLRSATLLGALLCTAIATAAPHAEQRLAQIAAVAEQSTAQARTMLVQEGPGLIAGAPYAVRIQYLRLLRRIHADSANLAGVNETNEQIIALAEAEGDPHNLALASLGRAQNLIVGNDPAAALGQLETLRSRYRKLGNPEFDAGLEALLGSAHSALGQYDRALRHFQQALDLLRRHPGMWTPREPDVLLALVRMYVNLREPARALETLGEIRGLKVRLTPRNDAAAAFFEGQALVARGELETALDAFGRSLELAREHGLESIQANALGNIADVHLKAQRYPEAEAAARAALPTARKSTDQISVQIATANLGFALYGQGRQQEGMGYIDAVIANMRKAGAMATVAQLLAEKSRALEKAGYFREALATAHDREEVTRKLALDDRNKAIAALQEQYKAREAAAQIETLRSDNSLKDAQLRERQLLQTVASFGTAVTLFVLAGVLWMYRRSERTGRRLAALNDELAYRSAHDPLTGLYNRRSFQDRMRTRTGETAARPDAADCFTLLDIDHFKRINDEYGHVAGDAVLVEVGKRLRGAMRGSDMVLRWGGEEFLVYSQGVAPAQQPLLVQRILNAIAATPVRLEDGSELRVSATAGAVSLPFDRDEQVEQTAQLDWEQAIALADRALYKGKEAGRNRGYIVAGMRRPEGGLELDLVLPGVAA